jgi:hypothetical protein
MTLMYNNVIHVMCTYIMLCTIKTYLLNDYLLLPWRSPYWLVDIEILHICKPEVKKKNNILREARRVLLVILHPFGGEGVESPKFVQETVQ